MGSNTTKIILILGVILGVGVVAKLLDRNIDNTPSGPDQVTGRGPIPESRKATDSRLQTQATPPSKTVPLPAQPSRVDPGAPGRTDWANQGSAAPVAFPGDTVDGVLNGGVGPDRNSRPLAEDHAAFRDPAARPVTVPPATDGSDLERGTIDPAGNPAGNPAGDPAGDPAGVDRAVADRGSPSGGGSEAAADLEPARPGPVRFEPSRPEPARLDEGRAGRGDLANSGVREDGTRPPLPRPRVDASGYPRKHKVSEGDSLWSIANNYYQRPELFRVILEANPELGDGELLKVGAEIVIPAPPAPSQPAGQPPAAAERPAKPPVATDRTLPAGMVSYVVREGDTLYGIARDRLGDPLRVEEILKANPGVDPLTLRVGQALKIPAK